MSLVGIELGGERVGEDVGEFGTECQCTVDRQKGVEMGTGDLFPHCAMSGPEM